MQRWGFAGVGVLAALWLAACSGGDGGNGGGDRGVDDAARRATIKGTVLDALDVPLAGAQVQLQDTSLSVQTAADGTFQLQTPFGPKKLTFSKAGEVVVEHCLVVAEGVTYELGTLTPATPTHCDTVCTADATSDDRDCDGVLNAVEQAGWSVTVTLGDGTPETRFVASTPTLRDTDGDGLTDGEEFAARSDPTRKDSDGDMLSDYAEIKVYKSHPLRADTDGDSRGPNGDEPSDPNLWDGYEVLVSHTSPVLADTDGDGRKDYEEIHSGGTSPLLADLPILALEVYGDPLLSLPHAEVSTGCEDSFTTLEREALDRVNTDNVTTKMSIENTVKLHTETEAGTSTWPPSFSAKLTTDTEFKHGYIHETTLNVTETSARDNQKKTYCWEKNNSDFSNGEISVAMKLKNQSSLSFKLKKIRVIAYQLATGSRFRLIGSLEPEAWEAGGEVLGPHGEITMTVKKTGIDAPTMKSLILNPSALMFEIGAYELFQLDEFGVDETVNYAKLGESVVQQTGLLTIDYGDGTLERHMIATNVNRNPDGSASGISLKDALTQVLKIPYQTETQKDSDGNVIGRKVLKQVKTTATYQNDDSQPGRGFWIVGGNGDAFAVASATNFDDLLLKSGERISLVYLKDTDLDGLFDNEEQLLGSDLTRPDTDGDSLSDYDEAKVGWTVNAQGESYGVNADPRAYDVDGDYLLDSTEEILGTDPYVWDTDADGIADTNDPYPLFALCVSPVQLGIAAWWDGRVAAQDTTIVEDIWPSAPLAEPSVGDPLGYQSHGVLAGLLLPLEWQPDYATAAPPNAVFSFNTSALDQHDQQITVADSAALDVRRTLSPQAQFTVSTWVYWNGVMTGAPYATLLTKGIPGTETYGLYVRADGAIAFGLYRYTHEKWWSDVWGDAACADEDHPRREWLETATYRLPLQAWTHLTATFGNETMRIYANGTLVQEYVVNPRRECSAACWCRNDTTYLLINTEPLRLALERAPATSAWPFRGMLDDVQLFGRQMTAKEVALSHEIGVCTP